METIANLELLIRRRTNRGEKISFILTDETGIEAWVVDPCLSNWRADRERVFVRYGVCEAVLEHDGWIHITK